MRYICILRAPIIIDKLYTKEGAGRRQRDWDDLEHYVTPASRSSPISRRTKLKMGGK